MSDQEPIIVRTQFTRWDEGLHPECDNAEYLEYERVKSGISEGILSYGYQWRWPDGRYQWAKLSEVAPCDRRPAPQTAPEPGDPAPAPQGVDPTQALHDMAAYKTTLEGKLAKLHSMAVQANVRGEYVPTDFILEIIEGPKAAPSSTKEAGT